MQRCTYVLLVITVDQVIDQLLLIKRRYNFSPIEKSATMGFVD